MKLVRDRIPELVGAGQLDAFYQATEAECGRLLRAKLLEEAAEAATASPDGLLEEELGDVLQVLYALASQAGYSPAEIECARARTGTSAQDPQGLRRDRPITRASGLRQVVLARAVGNRRLSTTCHLWPSRR
jgi:predicted house-cleaning noncanonical NTP pyrophosphatase (MazG superfamily)